MLCLRLLDSCLHNRSSAFDFSRFNDHIYGQSKERGRELTVINYTPHESMPVGNYPGGDSHLKVVIVVQD